MDQRAVLSINAGSSSVKCAIFTCEPEPRLLVRETIDGAGASAATHLLDWIATQEKGRALTGVGHRIVHGGPTYQEAQPITAKLREALTGLIRFAPNHLPDEIALVDAVSARWPTVPQFACFDTGFHAHLPEVARRLPIPKRYDAEGVRRYGFHGLSYTFLIQELERVAGPEAAAGRVVLAHLGNGSSLAAVHNRRSIDTTMAFTPIGGVVMSTRSGDLDPGVVTYIARRDGLSADATEDRLSHQSGLLAISGTTGDMRVLLDREAQDPACQLAVAIYVYSIRKAIGSLAAALGGLDTLVFTGGIGEHAPVVRSRICEGLGFLGIQIDSTRNDADASLISNDSGHVDVRVIPTNEELVISRAVYALVESR